MELVYDSEKNLFSVNLIFTKNLFINMNKEVKEKGL